MIQSMVNIQMDQAKKMFKEIPGKINTLIKKFPPELECYGFKVSDLDIAYKKSQMQTSAYFKEVPADKVNQTMCEEFHQKLNEHPEAILKQLKGDKNSPFNKAYEQWSNINTDAAKDALLDDFGTEGAPEDEVKAYEERKAKKAVADSAFKDDL